MLLRRCETYTDNCCEQYQTSNDSGHQPNLIGMLVLLVQLYAFFGYILPDNLEYLILIMALISIALHSVMNNMKVSDIQLLYIFLALTFVMINMLPSPYSVASSTSIKTSLVRSTLLAFGVLLTLQQNWYSGTLKYFFGFSLFHACATLFSYFLPDLFIGRVMPFLPLDIAQASRWFLDRGLYAGVTNQIGVNAFYLSIGMLSVYSALFESQRKPFLLRILLGVFFLALLLTGKRGQLLSIIMSMTSVVIIDAKVKGKSIVIHTVLAFLLLAGSMYFAILFFPESANPILRFAARMGGGDLTSGRTILYGLALSLFREKPIFGWGTGVFSATYGIGTHNTYLQVLCENGLFGLVVFMGMLFLNLLYTLKTLSSSIRKETTGINILVFSFSVQMFFLVYAFVENALNDGFTFSVYLIATSMTYSLHHERLRSQKSGIVAYDT